MAASVTENVTKLSFASERMQAGERAHNFVVDFSSNDFNCHWGVAMSITVSISAVQTRTLDFDTDEMSNSRHSVIVDTSLSVGVDHHLLSKAPRISS